MRWCNLCGFPVIRLSGGIFGKRCIACLSTFIHRAMAVVIEGMRLPMDSLVYEMSSRGALVRYLRRRFQKVVCSEFFPDVPPGASKGRLQCQDVQRLSYPDGSFNLVTSTEVFEHVPNDMDGFRQVPRVLRAQGAFVFTVPLREAKTTVERCSVKNGQVQLHLPPDYHKDWSRSRRKVLTFRNYGLDILERLALAGLKGQLRLIHNPKYAIDNTKVIVATKA